MKKPSHQTANKMPAEAAAEVASDVTSDGQLLARFVQTVDERAFRQLVERHTQLVYGVCVRVLHHRHDAEEAFQATFLVLAQKAATLQVSQSLAPWLYGVAYRTAVRALQKRSRRKEQSLTEPIMISDETLDQVASDHWRAVLDDELNRLPKKYREPLVLHYLLNKSNPEIAAELGLTVRTVEGRQRRGKQCLRRQLSLRKVSLPLAVATLAAGGQSVATAALAPLIDSTVVAGLAAATGQPLPPTSQPALQLTRPEVIAMPAPFAPIAMIATLLVATGTTLGLTGPDNTSTESPELEVSIPAEPILAKPVQRDFAVLLAASETTEESANTDNPSSASPDDSTADPFGDESDPAPTSTPIPAAAPDTAMTASLDATAATDELSDSLAFLPRSLSVAERKIYQKLAAPIPQPIDFNEMPLGEVAEHLSDLLDIQIVLDLPALYNSALTEEDVVTARIRNLPAKFALELLLANIHNELTYLIKHNALILTTKQAHDRTFETRIYHLSDTRVANDDIAEVLKATVQPQTWLDETGKSMPAESLEYKGTTAVLPNDLLAVRQTQSVHAEIVAFLTELKKHTDARIGRN